MDLVRANHQSQTRWFARIAVIVGIVMCLAFTGLSTFERVDSHLLSGDGYFYYSYVRSFWIDHDLDLRNEAAIYNSTVANDYAKVDPNNPVAYVFSVGPAVLWSPFFALGHGVASISSHLGGGPANGFSFIEEFAISIGSIIYCTLGLFLVFLVLARFFDRRAALVGGLATFFASPVVYYTVFEPSMSHALEYFSVALLLWLALLPRKKYFLSGLVAGLVFIVRWQNIFFWLLVPLMAYQEHKSGSGALQWRALTGKALRFVLGVLPIIAVQIVFWKITSGHYLTVPQGPGFLHFGEPKMFEVLFSSNHGLFFWHPILLLGFIGIFLIKKWERVMIWTFLLIFVLMLYVNSIVFDWWAGHAFGMRRFIGFAPVFSLGLAALYAKATRKRILEIIFLVLAVWNLLFIMQYVLWLIPHDQKLGWNQVFTDKIIMIGELPAKIADRL